MSVGPASDRVFLPHRCAHSRRNTVLQDILLSTCLHRQAVSTDPNSGKPGRTLHYTAQCVKNSLGGEIFGGDQVDKVLLSSFLLETIYELHLFDFRQYLLRPTFCKISYTVGSASSRLAASSCKSPKLAKPTSNSVSY